MKLRDQFSNTILLESSDYIAKDNSYAYICCNPIAKFYVIKNILHINYPDGKKTRKVIKNETNIFSELNDFMKKFDIQDLDNPNNKFITKGLFGYMSYDSIKFFENIKVSNDSFGDEIPEIFYSFYSEIIVVNTFNNEATLISYSKDKKDLQNLEKSIKAKKINEFGFKLDGELKSNLNKQVVQILGTLIPNFSNMIESSTLFSPLDLENEFGLTEGNLNHGEMTLDQLLFMRPTMSSSQYKTPIENLFLCGPGTHPGGGLHGTNGYNAAKAILK